MNKLLTLITALCLVVIPLQADAAKKAKLQSDKVAVVLLPLVISSDAQSMASEMQAAVVQGLQQKYKVFSGDRVLQELQKSSERQNHSTKKRCDETRCLQDVAIAFQTENVAVVHINKIDGGYLLSLSIKDVISNEAVFDNSLPCEDCNAFKVVEKLKELSGTEKVASTTPTVDGSPLVAKVRDAETDLWEEVNKSNTADDYRAYLKQFPKGKFVELAKSRVAKLLAEAKTESENQERQSWTDAQQSNSVESYQGYLNDFPKGKFAVLAQGRVDKLRKEQAAEEAKLKRETKAAESKQLQEVAKLSKGFVSQGGLTWMPVSFYKNWSDANSYCNNNVINGQTGWRLPTKDELLALYKSGAMNNKGWVLNFTLSSTPSSGYNYHYGVFLNDGIDQQYNDAGTYYVTCVRETSQLKPNQPEQFEVRKSRFISQNLLTWMPIRYFSNWKSAEKDCSKNTDDNQIYGHWRLPTKDELVDLYHSGAMKDQEWKLGRTWSSTPNYGNHFIVDLDSGNELPLSDSSENYVTCVHN